MHRRSGTGLQLTIHDVKKFRVVINDTKACTILKAKPKLRDTSGVPSDDKVSVTYLCRKAGECYFAAVTHYTAQKPAPFNVLLVERRRVEKLEGKEEVQFSISSRNGNFAFSGRDAVF